ncbi:unnamed protein product [Strongylus vulgaris]|uniref:Uncharacterized protein n=1 Tax=Strongylus vulgaris TaxID=40348 RepID=A0A3P7J5A3_STRVU|nr:unnamed protein product [Strongylus vulgaris]
MTNFFSLAVEQLNNCESKLFIADGRPHILDCSSGVFYDGNGIYTQKSCDKCCKQAARLEANMKESEILGMMLVIDKKTECACCAPYRPYMDLLGVPLQYTVQPQYPSYQPSPPSHGQHIYPNYQPTGY